MAYRIPYLAVTGPNDVDQLKAWGSRLVGVRIVTRFVDASDECTFTFTNEPPYATAPAENTPFSVKVGWSAEGATLGGTYYMQRIHLWGDPKTAGDMVSYICRSGQMAGLDQADSRHFNEQNGNKTLKDVFTNLFADAGMGVDVAASIAGLPIPGGHLVQWNQSAIDFATDLANDVGGIVKPMGGKILVLDRNSGQSVSGQSLAGWTILKTPGYSYDCEFEPRFQYQSVAVPYMDDAAGRVKSEVSQASGGGAKQGAPHPAADQGAAQTQAKARADEFRRFTGTGIFEMPGEPNAVAGSHPTCSGFPDPIDSTAWIAAEVTHDVEPGQGWITTVELETDPE